MRTYLLVFQAVRIKGVIDNFTIGLRVNAENQVLQTHVIGREIFTGGSIQDIVIAQLAAGNHDPALLTADFNLGDHALKGPVEVMLIIIEVLEIPDQLTALRIKGQGSIGIQCVVVDPRNIHGIHQWAGVIGLRRAKQSQVIHRVIGTGCPD